MKIKQEPKPKAKNDTTPNNKISYETVLLQSHAGGEQERTRDQDKGRIAETKFNKFPPKRIHFDCKITISTKKMMQNQLGVSERTLFNAVIYSMPLGSSACVCITIFNRHKSYINTRKNENQSIRF